MKVKFTAPGFEATQLGEIIKEYEPGKYLVKQLYPTPSSTEPQTRFVFGPQVKCLIFTEKDKGQ